MPDRLDATPPRPEQALADWHPAAWNDRAQPIAHVVPPTDSRAHALSCLLGLVSPAERTKSWQSAAITGAPTPSPCHHLLGRAEGSPDAVRAALLASAPTIRGHPETIGVVDDAGLLQNGAHAAGVTRQSTGTASRVEPCQAGVLLTDARPPGHTLLDWAWYLPARWTHDPGRGPQAGGPTDRTFATQSALARQMIARAAAAGITWAWSAGDTVDGDDRPVRHWLDAPSQPDVLGMPRTDHRWSAAQRVTLTDRAASRADTAGERHSGGDGSQGPGWYDWAATALNAPPQAGVQRRGARRRPVDAPQDGDA